MQSIVNIGYLVVMVVSLVTLPYNECMSVVPVWVNIRYKHQLYNTLLGHCPLRLMALDGKLHYSSCVFFMQIFQMSSGIGTE